MVSANTWIPVTFLTFTLRVSTVNLPRSLTLADAEKKESEPDDVDTKDAEQEDEQGDERGQDQDQEQELEQEQELHLRPFVHRQQRRRSPPRTSPSPSLQPQSSSAAQAQEQERIPEGTGEVDGGEPSAHEQAAAGKGAGPALRSPSPPGRVAGLVYTSIRAYKKRVFLFCLYIIIQSKHVNDLHVLRV